MKSYAGFRKGYLNKGERIAYAKKMRAKETCQMINCNNAPVKMGYCSDCWK